MDKDFDEDFDFGTADYSHILNDPDLINELQGLEMEIGVTSVDRVRHQPSQMMSTAPAKIADPIRFDTFDDDVTDNATAAVNGEAVEVELLESDVNDPELLQMFEQLSTTGNLKGGETIESSSKTTSSSQVKGSIASPPLKPLKQQSFRVADNTNGGNSSTGIDAVEAKNRALAAKRAGDTNEALRWFRLAKQLDGSIGNNSTSSQSIASKQASSNPNSAAFDSLEHALREASSIALQAAKKLRNSDAGAAVVKMKEYKRWEQELSTLTARKTIPTALPPSFRWIIDRKEVSLERLDIAETDLKVVLDGVFEIDDFLATLGSSRSISFSVALTGSGGTKEEGPGLSSSGGPVKYENRSAAFNHNVTMPVLKRAASKVAGQALLRKKIQVTLVLQRGYFYSALPFATGILPLAELATKSEIGGQIPLYKIEPGADSGKKGKAIGGYLQLQLRMRKPLSAPITHIVEERRLVMDAWPSIPMNRPPELTTPKVEKGPQAIPITSSSSSTAIATTAAPGNNGNDNNASGLTARELQDPEAVDFLDSNDVLEAEIALAESQLQSDSLDEDQKFSTGLRLQMLRVRLQTLVMNVQNETLSLPDYLEMLKERIKRDQYLALHFKRQGDEESKAMAVKILRRIKLMQQEIDSASEGADE